MGRISRQIDRRAERMQSAIIRDFSGGWNVIDNDLNLDSRFSKVMRNCYRATDNSVQVRFGTRLFTQLGDILTGDIINMVYYNTRIVAVSSRGEIATIDGTGEAELKYSDWSAIDFCSFTQFNGELIMCNGIDKPLIMDTSFDVQFLQDLATLTNINTPIGKLCKTHQDFLVITDTVTPDRINISAAGTSGTFLGDPDPNDAVVFDLGSYIPEGDTTIIGLGSYRDKLAVMFQNATVIMSLGAYNSSNAHVPVVEDVLLENGCISHRGIQTFGDDMLYADNVGVPSIERALFTGNVRPSRVSELIDPAIRQALDGLSFAAMENYVFSGYNRREGQYMLFTPSDEVFDNSYQSRAFVFTFIRSLKIRSWSDFWGWRFRSACRSELNRMFFSEGTNIFVYGTDDDPIYSDYEDYMDTFTDGTMYTDNTGNTPSGDYDENGLPIEFVWELPWADMNNRALLKQSRYLSIETKGTARFTVDMFVDNLYEDRSDTGEAFVDNTLFDDDTGFTRIDPELVSTLSMEFVGGDNLGFGANFGNNFGGGRITSDERLYAWTTNFKIGKLRMSGSTKDPLRFVSLGLHYLTGGIRR